MKIKTALLAIFLISQTTLADQPDISGDILLTALSSSVIGFLANISPNDNRGLLKNNAIGASLVAMYNLTSSQWAPIPNEHIGLYASTAVCFYAIFAILSRASNKLATSNVKNKHECPCGKIFNKKDEFLKHLLEHGFKVVIPEIVS